MTRVAYAMLILFATAGPALGQAPDSLRAMAPSAPADTARVRSRAAADSLRMRAAANAPGLTFDALDRFTRQAYLRRHAFSLDNFLEFEPSGFVVRHPPGL